MKRIFALIISLMLVACLFAACGDDDTYRQPGTGTTLGGKVTTPAIDDQNGSYSADPDGEVNQTTDNDNILEDGMNDLENGIEQGMDDIEQGLDDLGNGAENMLGGNDGEGQPNLDENLPEAQNIEDDPNYEGIAGPSQPSGMDAEGDNVGEAGNNNNNNNNAGNTNGATNGNSH